MAFLNLACSKNFATAISAAPSVSWLLRPFLLMHLPTKAKLRRVNKQELAEAVYKAPHTEAARKMLA
jgi:hypothetical protein